MANHAKVLDVSEEDREVLVSRVQARTVSVRDRPAHDLGVTEVGEGPGELAERLDVRRR
jgi:hypothetical protein